MTSLDGQIPVPGTSEAGLEFTNTQTTEVAYRFTPSGTWTPNVNNPSLSGCTAAGVKGYPPEIQKGILDVVPGGLGQYMKYPNNTPFALLAINKATGAVVAEVSQATTIPLKPGETLVFVLNDMWGGYSDNSGSITVNWSGVGASALKIQSGTTYNGAFQDSTWKLHEGPLAERVFNLPVKFESKFTKPPKIFIEISGLDVNAIKNTRVQVTAKNITESGFDLEYKTWYDTILYSVWTNWMAFGE